MRDAIGDLSNLSATFAHGLSVDGDPTEGDNSGSARAARPD
jgi:hypothetical protein